MPLAAVLVDSLHAALEDAAESFNAIDVDFAASIFASSVPNEIMLGEVVPEVGVPTCFVGHEVSAARDIRSDDRQQIGRCGSRDMQRTRALCRARSES
jgi:hypothetical protein